MTDERAQPEPTPSQYAEVDETIERWVTENKLALCREWQGEARFWYTSRGSECFQIFIDRPYNGYVTVHAVTVETADDAELRGEWTVGINELQRALVIATKLIDLWADRARMSD